MSKNPGQSTKTAAELVAELQADPEYVAERQLRSVELDRKADEWRAAEVPLVNELREAGFEVKSAWDLASTAEPYPEALPILFRRLNRSHTPQARTALKEFAAFGFGSMAMLNSLNQDCSS